MLRKFMILLFVLLFLFAFAAPALAQGPEETATPEATAGAPPTAVIAAPEAEAPLPETSLMARFMRFVDGLMDTLQKLIAGFLALVAAVLGAAAYFLGRQNITVKDAIEKLYLSMPPQAQLVIREGVLAAQSINKFADEVTDGRPNSAAAGTITRTTTETVSAPAPPSGKAESPPKITPPSTEALDG